MALSYRRLMKQIQEMDEHHLDDDVTIYIIGHDEYYPAIATEVTNNTCDTLDNGHTVIVVE